MKCYVVVVRAYTADQYVDVVFTSRELAEAYIEQRRRVAYAERDIEEHDLWDALPLPHATAPAAPEPHETPAPQP